MKPDTPYMSDPPPGAFNQIVEGAAQIMSGVKGQLDYLQNQVTKLMNQLEAKDKELEQYKNPLPQKPIIKEGKQKAFIAILHAIYKAGYIRDITEKEFMQRVATAFGCPGIANYASALYNFKETYSKYEETFDELIETAKREKTKND